MSKKEEVKVDPRFPRNLYKAPGKIRINANKSYDTILVEDEEEMEDAIKKGFVDSFADALKGKVEKPKKTELDDGF